MAYKSYDPVRHSLGNFHCRSEESFGMLNIAHATAQSRKSAKYRVQSARTTKATPNPNKLLDQSDFADLADLLKSCRKGARWATRPAATLL